MNNPTGPSEIESLLSERSRFETWLEQLAAKAASMPPHVVERVRADYQQRLDKVIDSLLSQSDAMRSEATSLDERVRSLAEELAGKRDARAEDELRALVGEYDSGAWEAKVAEHDAGIQSLEAERAALEAEHNRIQQLLAEAVRPSRPSTPMSTPAVEALGTPDTKTVAEPAPAVVATPDAPPVETAPPAQAAATVEETPAVLEHPAAAEPPPAPKAPPRASPFDEIGFMRAVVGRTTPFPGVGAPSVSDAPRAPTPTPGKEHLTIAAPPPAEDAAPVPAASPAAPSEPLIRSSSDRKVVPAFEAPPIPDAPIVAPVRASSPAIPMIVDEASMADSLRASTSSPDAARTLKCQECGWMNYPTEWYCEKCGGELAAF